MQDLRQALPLDWKDALARHKASRHENPLLPFLQTDFRVEAEPGQTLSQSAQWKGHHEEHKLGVSKTMHHDQLFTPDPSPA